MILLDKTLNRLRTKVLPYMNLVSFVCRGLQASSLKYPNALLSKVLYVNPKKIDAVSSLPIKPKKGSLFFLDGDWDKESTSIEYAFNNDYKYKSAREILLEKMPLTDTSEFKHVQKKINRLGAYRGYKNPYEYINSIETVYKSILKDGYQKRKNTLNPWIGEVEVALGRDGKLIKINSGNHRFACAYLFGIKEIPINLCAVHEEYKNILEEDGIKGFNKKMAKILNDF